MDGMLDKFTCRHCGSEMTSYEYPIQCPSHGCNSISFEIWVIPIGGHEPIELPSFNWDKSLNLLGYHDSKIKILFKKIWKWVFK